MSFQDIEAGRPFGSRCGLINGKQDATQAVAAGIFQINTAVSTFQRLVNTLGTPKDTPELREKLHKTRLHIGQLVKDTSAKLKQASDIDHHAEVNASKKIAAAKLAKDFQAVLKEFQKAQCLAAERETAYTPFVSQAVLPSSYTASEIDVGSDKTPEQRPILVESRSFFMATWRSIKLFTYLLVWSSFIWSTGRCSLGDSISSQVVGSPNSNSIIRSSQAFSLTQKFLMQSFYERYTNLFDSDFEKFMSQKVTSSLCEVLADNHTFRLRLAGLKRNLIGDGSHRCVSTLIKFQTQQSKYLSEILSYSCELIIIERLPSGVFADPFELQRLVQRGVFSDIAVFGDTNLELPSFLSNRSAVEIHLNVDPNILLEPTDINIELPLHARYQPLNESGYTIVEFGAPDMLVQCSTLEKLENRNCLFKLENDDAHLYDTRFVWRIPSGKIVHADLVSAVTFISALLSTLVIVVVSLYYSSSKLNKDLKQS